MKNRDLVEGSVLKTLMIYSLPLIATNLVQILFHATDIAVLGIMVDDAAVAAVGACGSLISLFVSLFSGLATGATVLVATRVGAKDVESTRRATGVSLTVGFLCGVILMLVAMIGAEQFLIWINCQPELIADAALYMRIYFAGMPIFMMYNFVAGILRAVGNSTKPMMYMIVAGVLNVALNAFCIGVLGLTVAGVAIATVSANLIALILAMIELLRNDDYCKVELKNIRLRKTELWRIVKIGVPASFGGLCFYTSNIFVASAVNAMGQQTMTANAISNQFDGVIYTVGVAVAIGCTSMVGQAVGAKDFSRVTKIIRVGSLYATALSLILGVSFVLGSRWMLDLMTDSPAVIEIAREKMIVLCLTYFITSIMEVHSFSLNAMQRSHITALVCLICGLAIRSAWVFFVAPLHNSIGMIYLSYPVSAFIAVVIYFFACSAAVRHLRKVSGL